MPIPDRILLHLPDRIHLVVEPDDVYLLEAQGDRTKVRSRSSDPVYDLRQLSELLPLFAPHGFLRIHRSYAVNLRRVQEIRPRHDSPDYELKMEPPVNRVLPVSRNRLQELWAAYGE